MRHPQCRCNQDDDASRRRCCVLSPPPHTPPLTRPLSVFCFPQKRFSQCATIAASPTRSGRRCVRVSCRPRLFSLSFNHKPPHHGVTAGGFTRWCQLSLVLGTVRLCPSVTCRACVDDPLAAPFLSFANPGHAGGLVTTPRLLRSLVSLGPDARWHQSGADRRLRATTSQQSSSSANCSLTRAPPATSRRVDLESPPLLHH